MIVPFMGLGRTKISVIPSLIFIRFHSSKFLKAKDIVIASAVRTPLADYESLNAAQLGALAIEGAWKQSRVGKEKIQKFYLYSSRVFQEENNDIATKAASFCGLNKLKCRTLTTDSVDSVRSAAEDLVKQRASVVIAGSLDSISNDPTMVAAQAPKRPVLDLAKKFHLNNDDLRSYYVDHHSRLYTAAQKSVFDSEILPVRMRQHKKILTKTVDEVGLNTTNHLNGAAALLMTTEEVAAALDIHPLSKLVDYEVSQSNPNAVSLGPTLTVRKLLERNDADIKDIARWEVQSCAPGMTLAFSDLLNVPPNKINVHGLCATLEKPINLACICLLTHLSHTMMPGEKGVAVVSNDYGLTTAVLLEKLPIPYVEEIPKLTLYTKENCVLCDNLTDELDKHFRYQFKLEKVDINQMENRKYLRLYRNDVPVLFLNDQFLCMHTLNVKLLENKIRMIKLSRATKKLLETTE